MIIRGYYPHPKQGANKLSMTKPQISLLWSLLLGGCMFRGSTELHESKRRVSSLGPQASRKDVDMKRVLMLGTLGN